MGTTVWLFCVTFNIAYYPYKLGLKKLKVKFMYTSYDNLWWNFVNALHIHLLLYIPEENIKSWPDIHFIGSLLIISTPKKGNLTARTNPMHADISDII